MIGTYDWDPLVAIETKFLPLYRSSGGVSFRGFPTYPCPEPNLRSPILGQANPPDIKDRQISVLGQPDNLNLGGVHFTAI